jgi:hypothetical protein
MGQRVTDVATQFGNVKLGYDKFLNADPAKTTSTGAESTKAPSTPVAGGTPITAVTDAYSKFATTDAGDYFFAVTSRNRYGNSALLELNPTTAFAVAAGKSVDLSFTDPGGAIPATCYVIYCTKKNDTSTGADRKYYPLFTVSTAERTAGYDNAGPNLVRNRNRWMPDTQQCFLYENSTDIFEFKQLAPLMKMDLAVIGPSSRFMMLLYGTPQLYAPKKVVRFINIGA